MNKAKRRPSDVQLRGLVHRLKAEGRQLLAYGAAAKGTALLSYCRAWLQPGTRCKGLGRLRAV